MLEDLEPFFYEYGEDAVYTNVLDGTTDTKVIYDRSIQESIIGDALIRNHEHTALVKSEDIPDVASNETLNVRSTDFYIVDYYELDIDELKLVVLSKDPL